MAALFSVTKTLKKSAKGAIRTLENLRHYISNPAPLTHLVHPRPHSNTHHALSEISNWAGHHIIKFNVLKLWSMQPQ